MRVKVRMMLPEQLRVRVRMRMVLPEQLRVLSDDLTKLMNLILGHYLVLELAFFLATLLPDAAEPDTPDDDGAAH